MYKFENFKLIPFNRRVLEHTKSNYYNWFCDPATTLFNSHGLFPKSKEEMEDFLDALDKKNNNNIHYAIISTTKDSDIHVGNASIQSINWINRSAEIAIVIGEKDYRGIRLGEKVCRLLIQHGFEKLNLNRIWTGTAATNIAMNKVAEKIGMKLEGTFKQGMFLHGEFIEINCYAILANNFFIKKETGFDDK